MKLLIILSLLTLCSAAMADAEIYKWTNAQGVVNYTDDFAKIPSRYRRKALKVEELPIPTPTRQQEEKVLRDELTTPLKVTTPDSGQSTPAAPGKRQPTPTPTPTPTPRADQPVPVPLGAQTAPAQ